MWKKFSVGISEKRIKAPVCLFFFIFFIYILTFSGVNFGDGLSVFLTTRSIVNSQSLVIGSNDFNLFSAVVPPIERGGSVTTGRDGQKHHISGILMSVLSVPLYFIGNLVGKLFFTGINPELVSMFFFSLFNPFVLALLSVLIYFYLRYNGQKIGKSLAWAIFFALTTFVGLYAKTGFYEPLIALLLFLTYLLLFLFKLKKSFIFVVLAAIIYGLSLFTKGVLLIFLPIFTLYLIFLPVEKPKKAQALFSFLSISLLFFVFLCFYNYTIHGNYFFGGYAGQISSGQQAFFVFKIVHFINSFFGLLFSPGKGIVFYAPLMFLFFSNSRKYIQAWQNEDIVCFAIFVVSIIFYSFNFMGLGTAGWGPRYLMPTMPFVIILLAKFNYYRLGQSRLLTSLAIVGFLVQFPAALVRWGGFIRAFIDAGFARNIDFVPGLSPILWSWITLISIIAKPWHVLPNSISISSAQVFSLYSRNIPLEKITEFNLWFINALTVSKSLYPVVLMTILLICFFIMITGKFIIKEINIKDI